MIEYLLIAPWVVDAMYALAVVYAIYILVPDDILFDQPES